MLPVAFARHTATAEHSEQVERTRKIRALPLFPVGAFLNLQLGRPPLDLDGLVIV